MLCQVARTSILAACLMYLPASALPVWRRRAHGSVEPEQAAVSKDRGRDAALRLMG